MGAEVAAGRSTGAQASAKSAVDRGYSRRGDGRKRRSGQTKRPIRRCLVFPVGTPPFAGLLPSMHGTPPRFGRLGGARCSLGVGGPPFDNEIACVSCSRVPLRADDTVVTWSSDDQSDAALSFVAVACEAFHCVALRGDGARRHLGRTTQRRPTRRWYRCRRHRIRDSFHRRHPSDGTTVTFDRDGQHDNPTLDRTTRLKSMTYVSTK